MVQRGKRCGLRRREAVHDGRSVDGGQYIARPLSSISVCYNSVNCSGRLLSSTALGVSPCPFLLLHQRSSKNSRFPRFMARRACILEPPVVDASITTVPMAIPLIPTVRRRKFIARGGTSGQNCETIAHCWQILPASDPWSLTLGPLGIDCGKDPVANDRDGPAASVKRGGMGGSIDSASQAGQDRDVRSNKTSHEAGRPPSPVLGGPPRTDDCKSTKIP